MLVTGLGFGFRFRIEITCVSESREDLRIILQALSIGSTYECKRSVGDIRLDHVRACRRNSDWDVFCGIFTICYLLSKIMCEKFGGSCFNRSTFSSSP